jgi:galactose mutarotase-like enzyme
MSELDSITLSAGDASVTVVPALGGKISSLSLAGREWLWTSDVLRRTVPEDALASDDDVSYVETADSGGYDECFPTVGACRVPEAVPGFGGLRLPDHGELWSQRPAVDVTRVGARGTVLVTWEGRRMPYAFVRALELHEDGRVELRYAVTNRGAHRLPFVWSAHPLLALTPRTRLALPDGARMRVYAEHGIALGGVRSEHQWPFVEVRGVTRSFTRPAEVAAASACKLFLDLPEGTRRLAVNEGRARLEVEFEAADVPHVGLWVNNRGWTPSAGGTPYLNFAFEPCIGAPDTLEDALGAWDSAAWLDAGETRRWTLTWRGTRRN